MYDILLLTHSLLRWIVLIALLSGIGTALHGRRSGRAFTKNDNRLRHWTATLAHIQLMAGMALYTQSPLIKAYWSALREGGPGPEAAFFALGHPALMLGAIAILTVASAKAKREKKSARKFGIIATGYSLALLLILAAIPWPSSPWAVRPLFR